jgi:hypothetical protein
MLPALHCISATALRGGKGAAIRCSNEPVMLTLTHVNAGWQGIAVELSNSRVC